MDPRELIPGCTHFKWNDALYLHEWGVCHIPNDTEIANLTKLFLKLEEIRTFLNSPFIVHCAIRPILNNPDSKYEGLDYNEQVKGSPHSAHKVGLAVDFHPTLLTCEDAKAKLISELVRFNIRMEKPTVGWIHIDLFPVPTGGNRYFNP